MRGPASLVYERYLQLARDAASSGDRVLSENFLQHADHYFRLVRSMQPAQPAPQQAMDRQEGEHGDADEPMGADSEATDDGERADESGEQPDADFPQGQQFEREGDHRRRRGRRSRYRPTEGEGGERRETRGEGDEGEPREERRERRERAPREREEGAGPEGFSSSPKPAFLRD